MTTCHDPYTELDLYLQKAQDEIGKAVEELRQHEETSSWSSWEMLLPPPPAFRSHTLDRITRSKTHHKNRSYDTLSRICHDGNVVQLDSSNHTRNLKKSVSSSFFSKVNPESMAYKSSPKSSYSPNTRRRLWQKHSSLSFPETSKDSLLRAQTINGNFPLEDKIPINYSKSNGYANKFSQDSSDLLTAPKHPRYKQRSYSESSPYFRMCNESKWGVPRPPSGDVNLLSIWADNLVLEVDRSLSSELNSLDGLSPSSNSSLSPSKPDDPTSESCSDIPKSINDSPAAVKKYGSAGTRDSVLDLKVISSSPDSGIDQVICGTPEDVEDVVDSVFAHGGWSELEKRPMLNGDSLSSGLEHLTPPPAEFIEKPEREASRSVAPPSTRDRETQMGASQILRTANNVLESHCSSISLETKEIKPVAVVLPTASADYGNCAISTSICTVQQSTSYTRNSSNAIQTDFSSVSATHIPSKITNVKKQSDRKVGSWSGSLPSNSGRTSSKAPMSIQRSASSSEMGSGVNVSMDELAAFVQRLKSTTLLQSSQLASTISKNDEANKDAETQTTPLLLSRSSSFTWVTECDCSDWESSNHRSGSDDSNQMTNCSNSPAHNGTAPLSSSSSIVLSSDDDEICDAHAGSGNSSLYLSACSGSSESFDDVGSSGDEEKKKEEAVEDTPSSSQSSRHLLRSVELPIRGCPLEDISEEHVISETVSMKSTPSNPSLPEPVEQSASFPSTLRLRRNKPSHGPAQPIEPTVLVINDLNLKSISAPLLRQKHPSGPHIPDSSSSDSSPTTASRSKDSIHLKNQVSASLRAHSAKELNELQAIEACSWLRAAGFPQYAQMHEDNQFPIDICTVQKDHAFLHPDSIQSLFRRLNTLNRCAKMKFMDNVRRKSLHIDDSDEEEQCALSENWEFQRSSRRWSRIPSPSEELGDRAPTTNVPSSPKVSRPPQASPARKYLTPEEAYCSSHDSVFVDEQHSSPDSIRRGAGPKIERCLMTPSYQIADCSPGSSSGSGGTLEELQERNLRRSGSDRVKEGAKALLRRMETLKGKRKKKNSDNASATYSGTDGSGSSSLTSSPRLPRSQQRSDHSVLERDLWFKQKKKCFIASGQNDVEVGAHSDSECPVVLVSERWKDANCNDTKVVQHFVVPHPGVTVTSDDAGETSSNSRSRFKRSSSKKRNHLSPSSCLKPPDNDSDDKRVSYYDNITAPIVAFNDLCVEALDASNGLHESAESHEDQEIIIITGERRDSGVGSSLTRGSTFQQAPWHCFPHRWPLEVKCHQSPTPITLLTAPQLLLLRKLSLLKLTTVMEKFSPSSRTGWSWAVPKFIKRIRSPDYKDKSVFGVPLLVILQRTGQPLPVSIQGAIHYLRRTALDATGLFRKSGVRSRIQKLKTLNEAEPDKMSYEDQHAYDVADMLKQYFRELPEALLTNKLSETFISIFQHIPEDLRLEAVQAAIILMPDENREVLQYLLAFLQEVCEHADVNQMTATNLAVCFAPSLFHLSSPRSASSSPRRRKTVGVPDLRELNENRAAYECLSCMLKNYDSLFSISEEMISQSRMQNAGQNEASTLQELACLVYKENGRWKDYTDSCLQVMFKESKERYRGWVNVTQAENIDLSYKKLSDGHPLRLWKVTTDIEAPPMELLNHLLRERHMWDSSFQKWKVICRLDKQTEIFQYLCSSFSPHPPCDYCILRSWRTDLAKGTCSLIETSVEHPEAEVIPGSVRSVVLASRYLIEPCGSGKSRITHISRVDTRGRSPEWYNRAYGHMSLLLFLRLRNSFSHYSTDGPETKV